MYLNEFPQVIKDIIELYEILFKFSWSESCRAGGEPTEVRLSVTRSINCKEVEALERCV